MARQRGGSRLYRGVFRLLEGIGLKNAQARWESQSPFIQRAVPPLVIAALVILVMLPFRAPDPAALVLLAIVYALYVMPRTLAKVGAARRRSSRFAVAYPLLIQQTNYQRFLFEVPIFNSFPSIDTMAVMAIFAMMAVGLNMVVGYAGLLDLGYVAFYALGAYTAAWLASPHASQFTLGGKPIDVNIGGIGVTEGLGGIHISIWVVLVAAAIVTAVGGILIGLPTLRLRGDYLAIVTLGFGEIIAEVARNGDSETLGFNLTGGPPGINPIDPPGFGVWLSDHLGLPANYIDKYGQYVNFVSLFYWSAIVLLLITIFCSIRMRDSTARPRVDRHPRGRGRRSGDGDPAHADEDLGLRLRRVLRRRGRCLVRLVQARRLPGRLLLRYLDLHPLDGDPRRDGQRVGCRRGRCSPHVPEPGRAFEHVRVVQRQGPPM